MKATSLSLTRNELTSFLALLGLTNRIGADVEGSSADLAAQEMAEQHQNGERSLVSRGLLKPDGPDVAILDDTLVALVGAAALPVATAVFTWVERNRAATPYYFSATSQLLVEHVSHQADAHTFNYLADSDALTARVSALLEPLRAGLGSGSVAVTLSTTTFSAFMKMAANGDAEAVGVLASAGCEHELAGQLAADINRGAVLFGMAAWGLRDPRPASGRTLVAATTDNRCWLAEEAMNDPSHLQIRRVNGAECQAAFLSLLEPLIAARASR